MKKLLSVILTVVMLLGVFASCTALVSSNSEKGESSATSETPVSSESDAKSETDTDTEPDTEAETETETQTNTEAETETETATEIETENKSINGNLPGKTVSKRQSYVSSRSPDVEYVSSEIESENVILVELDGYTSIAEKGADKKIYPASMTKVMSLLVVCENLRSLATKFTVTQDIVDYSIRMEGSGIGLKAGEKLDAQDLLYLTAYQSDTIAVIMLANYIGGSEEGFVKMMNEKATQLGLKNTRFANCTGLHDPNNYTTCREMAAIFAYALENPLCKELLTSYESYTVDLGERTITIYSSWYSGRFEDRPRLDTVTVSGGKTGYIDESGFSLVSYAIRRSDKKEYIQVIVGQPKGSGLTETKSVRDIKYIYNDFT